MGSEKNLGLFRWGRLIFTLLHLTLSGIGLDHLPVPASYMELCPWTVAALPHSLQANQTLDLENLSIHYPDCPQQIWKFFKLERIPPNLKRVIVPNATTFVSGFSSPSPVAGHRFTRAQFEGRKWHKEVVG